MVRVLKGIGLKIWLMDLENTNGAMDVVMRVNGKIIKCTGKDIINGMVNILW